MLYLFSIIIEKMLICGKDSVMDEKWKALEKYNLWKGNTYQLGLERKSYIDKIYTFVRNI